MAEDGIVGEFKSGSAREVLYTWEEWEALKNGGEPVDLGRLSAADVAHQATASGSRPATAWFERDGRPASRRPSGGR